MLFRTCPSFDVTPWLAPQLAGFRNFVSNVLQNYYFWLFKAIYQGSCLVLWPRRLSFCCCYDLNNGQVFAFCVNKHVTFRAKCVKQENHFVLSITNESTGFYYVFLCIKKCYLLFTSYVGHLPCPCSFTACWYGVIGANLIILLYTKLETCRPNKAYELIYQYYCAIGSFLNVMDFLAEDLLSRRGVSEFRGTSFGKR
jgi:hypothetical protein